jgi:threonine dehydratase
VGPRDAVHARRLAGRLRRRAPGAVLSGASPIDVAAIEAARRRLAGAVAETPCPFSRGLSDLTGTRCFLKLENLQMTGSFKERGAANLLLQLDAAERARGVVTASAGNHGLAVAYHAGRLGIAATIVMPEWAPLIKVTSARRYRAEVRLHGANFDEAYADARVLATERGMVFVHPFDDLAVIAGQGTLGLELVEQHPELDAVLVPVGGGGLIAGVGVAIKARRPATRVIGVQSAAMAAMRAALDAGGPVTIPPAATIADGIAVGQVGRHTFAVAAAGGVDEIVTVSEEELANAILLCLEIEKTVVEGAGAAPLAALVNRRLGLSGARVALILSGGNIDVTMLSRIIERGLVKDGRLVRLGVLLRDRPGELARLTTLIAGARANVVHIEHDRAFARWAGIGETEVELTLETSGRDQIAALLARLTAGGYRVDERRIEPGR